MPLFRYQALNARGDVIEGEVEAATAADVAARLQEQGLLPIEARPAGAGAAQLDWRRWFRPRPFAGARLVSFTQQLATLLGAGQPLDRALTILLELPEDETARRSIADIRDAVRGGSPLSVALERQHGAFSRLYLNMVRAGEAGGSLHDTLTRLAEYLERSEALRGRVLNALIYPAILLLLVGASVLFLLGFVVPQFAAMYASLDAPLPWFTQWVLWLGEAVQRGWWLLLAALVLGGLWLERKRREPAVRARLDAWLLGQRLVGPLLAKIETARLARTLGTLLRNGVPLLAALGIARNVIGNQVLAQAVERAAEEVKNGVGLSAALAKGGAVPKLALQMMQVGEESGALDAMLLRTADVFEQDTGQALDRLLAALVPLITLVLTLVVGLVIVAVLVPIYDLTGAIGQ